MKKIGILTFHRALNYGAILQTYALQQYISSIVSKNTVVEVLDYRCEFIEKNRKVRARFSSNILKSLIRSIALVRKRTNFDRFRKEKVLESKQIYYRNTINDANNEYDLFIAGSDQVWNYNLTNYDYSYYLDFVKTSSKISTYAVSFGMRCLNEENTNILKKMLLNYEKISVRECTGEKMIKEIFKDKNVVVHLDPTLLLTGNDWKKLFPEIKSSQKKYILVYNVPKPDKLFEAAEILSEMTGYEIKYIPTGVRPRTNIKNLCFPNVLEFLELFFNASYVITNSFHGTVFSILFEKKMLVDLSHNGVRNERIEALINSCGLQNREINNVNNEEIMRINDSINWKEVGERLDILRASSKEYLKELISNICEE